MKPVKVYYVMCGTDGQVESAWMIGTMGDDIMVANTKDGEWSGNNPKSRTFFTKKQALSDWRYRASKETTEHADVINDVGEKLVAIAAKVRDKIRVRGDWRDL